MVAPSKFKLSFRDVFVHSPGRVFLVAGDDAAEKKDVAMSWALRWKGKWDNQPIRIRSTSLTMVQEPEPSVLFMGLNGVVARWGSAPAIAEEIVDASNDGAQYFGGLREIRTIGAKAYIVGMGRTVYRCDGPGNWIRLDAGAREDDEADEEVGFNSIDGLSNSKLVAVGWGGEVWTYSGKRWQQQYSPTNVALFKVIRIPDGSFVACGQKGAVLVGAGKKLEKIEHSATNEDFWSAAWFKGAVYLSTLNGLFRLKEGKVAAVSVRAAPEIETRPNVSFFRLHSDGQALWSIGSKMAIFTEDAAHWRETPYK